MKQRDILFFLASICIVVFAWIAFSLVHNALTSTISQETTQAIAPIQPTFDTATIEKLKARLAVTPSFTIQPASSQDVVVTPAQATPSPIQTASAPAIATSSGQSASGGGTIR